jgi:nicotinamidase/pyrazinamidase
VTAPLRGLPGEAIVVSKGTAPDEDAYSGFQARDASGQPFAALLRARGVARLFVGGLATDYCVKATVLDAAREGFEVVVLRDAMRAVDLAPGDGERAIAAMAAAGAVFVSLAELGAGARA